MGRPKKKQPTTNLAEDAMVRGLDRLAAYDNYRRDISPRVQELLASGASAQKILDSCQELAAAKLVEKALSGQGKEQMFALKELLDRSVGKAAEKIEIKSAYNKMSDAELDALLASKMKLLKDVGPKRED
jgi:hypothetical protein